MAGIERERERERDEKWVWTWGEERERQSDQVGAAGMILGRVRFTMDG